MIQAKQITLQYLNQQQEIFSSVNADFVLVADSADSFKTKKVTRSNFLSGLSTTLQSAYNNSSTPEIVTDATRVALTLRRGSVADTDVVLEVQNGAAVTKFSVSGNGLVGSIGNEFTSVAANPGGVAAQTLWANSSDSNKLYYGSSVVVIAGLITSSGLTMATNRILGRTTAATGSIEEITIGTGLSLSAGNLTCTVTGTIGGTIASDQIAVGGVSANTIGGASTFTWSPVGLFTAVQTANTGGTSSFMRFTAGLHTNLAASSEVTDIIFKLGRVVQFATGAKTTQRAFLIEAPNYAFVGASTITNAATFAISGAPIAGTNATITNSYALWVQSGNVRFDSVTTTLNAGTTSVNTGCLVTGSIADFFQYDIKNTSNGTGAQSGYSATADNGTGTTGFAFVGINNSGSALIAPYNIGTTNDVNFMGSGQDMYLANTHNTKSIFIALGKALSPYFFNVFECGNNAGVGKIIATTATFTWTQTATTGTTAGFLITSAAHTALTASTEAIDVRLNLARIVQFATGALTTQRGMLIQEPTYAFVGASTITNAATLAISGAPIAGTNATITSSMALWVQSGFSKFDGVLGVSNGTVSLPALTFSSDLNTGFYNIGADQIGVTTNGTLRLTISTTAFTGTLPWLGQNGTAANPALSFSGDSNTGLYNISADRIGIATGGTLRFDIDTTAVTSTLKLISPASIAGAASINLPHGTAPSSPVNGDEWTTTAGKFIRVNGVTTNVSRLVTTLTDGATINIDAATGDVFTVTIAGNRTIAAPTNPVNGRLMMLRIRQDATGSRTITWNAAFAFTAGLPAPTLTTGANKIDYVGFVYDSTTAKWHCISYVLGHN